MRNSKAATASGPAVLVPPSCAHEPLCGLTVSLSGPQFSATQRNKTQNPLKLRAHVGQGLGPP